MSNRIKLYLVVMTVTIIVFALPAYAFANNFNGGDHQFGMPVNGAKANIEVQNPSVSSVFSCAWSMLCQSSYSDRYAQVGWMKYPSFSGTVPVHFYEYSYGPTATWYRKFLGNATIGSVYNYRVECDSSMMYFYVDSSLKGNVPLGAIPFTRNIAEFYGETNNSVDQCPGSNSNPVTFSSVKYMDSSYNWVTCGVLNPYPDGYGSITTMRNNIDDFDSTWEIWDSRY